MKILIHGLNYAPDLVGIPKYTTEMAEWLVERGHEVAVVTGLPYYPAWKIDEGYARKGYFTEPMNGVQLYRCPIYVPQNPNGSKRLLHSLSFAISSLPVMIWLCVSQRPQLVISIAPALFGAPVSRLASFMGRCRSWLHIQDFEVDAAFELGLLKGRRIRKLALACERILLRAFDRVSSISPQMMQRLEEKGCDPEKLYELRNWVDLTLIYPLSGANRFRQAFEFSRSDTVVLYSGNIGKKQGIETLVDVAALLADRPDIQFLIAGEGPEKVSMVEQARGLPNMHFLPLQPLAELNMLLGAADIHVLPQRAGVADLVLPSKLIGMMASGRPVIAMAAPGTGIAQEIEGCGVLVPPGDAMALAGAVVALADDPESRARFGLAARMQSEEVYGRDSVLRQFEASCHQLL